MKKSALQRVRAEYQPKLPKALQGPVKLKVGEPTKSVADQEEIKKLFPHTYGMPVVEFERDDNPIRVEEPSGSRRTQCGERYLRRHQVAQSRMSSVRLPDGPFGFHQPSVHGAYSRLYQGIP